MILTNVTLNLIFQMVLHPVVVDLIHQPHLMKLRKMANQENQRQSQKDNAQGHDQGHPEDQKDHIPNQDHQGDESLPHHQVPILIYKGKQISHLGLGLWCVMPLSTIFQLYRTISFIGGGNPREPQTCRKSLTNFYHIMLYRVHLPMSGIRTHNI